MVAVCVLLILSFSALTYANQCPALMKRYCKDHTYCKPANPQCKILFRGISEAYKTIILEQHNMYRSKVAQGNEATQNLPPATNMMQLEWDDTLAAVAQKHAEQCKFDHDDPNCRRVSNFGVGQNLFQCNVTGQGHPKPDWKTAIKAFYDEVINFTRSFIISFVFYKPTAHFTQLIWANTWKIGCGYCLIDHGSGKMEQLYTCNYGPGGNIQGASIYKEGQPCSDCPTNSCCDDSCSEKGITVDHRGLCKMLKQEAPRYSSEGDNSFYTCTFGDEANCAISNVIGTNNWNIKETLSGSYLTIVLNGGETSTLTFGVMLKPTAKSFRFKFSYRKGANVDGEEALEGTVKAIFDVPSLNYSYNVSLSYVLKSFTPYTITLSWAEPTQVSFEFSVPAGKPAQYFEVSDMSASNCED